MELTDETTDILKDIVTDLEERIKELKGMRNDCPFDSYDKATIQGKILAFYSVIQDLEIRFGRKL